MLVPRHALVLVADGARFCLYKNLGKGVAIDLSLLTEEQHSVPRASELGNDRPGRSFDSSGPRRSAYESPDYHAREETNFAISAADAVNRYAEGNTSDVILVADPHTLGTLRQHIGDAVSKRIIAEIRRDYAARSPADVVSLLMSAHP